MRRTLVSSSNGYKPILTNKGRPKPPKIFRHVGAGRRIGVGAGGRRRVACALPTDEGPTPQSVDGEVSSALAESEDPLQLGSNSSGASNVLDVALGYGSTLPVDRESTVATETQDRILVNALESVGPPTQASEARGVVEELKFAVDDYQGESKASDEEDTAGTVLGVALGTAGTLPVLDEVVAPTGGDGEVTSSQELARATAPLAIPDTFPSKEVPIAPAPQTDKAQESAGHKPSMFWVLAAQVGACCAAAIADPLCTLADTYFISALGTAELASMSPNVAICNVFATLAGSSLPLVSTTLVARALVDRSEKGEAAQIISVAFFVSLVIGLAAAVALMSAPVAWLSGFGCDPEVMGLAKSYFFYRMIGVPASLLVLTLQGIYSAALANRTPVVVIALAGLGNVILDPILMFTFNMGVAGAAIATSVTQWCAAGVLLYLMLGRDAEKFKLKKPPLGLASLPLPSMARAKKFLSLAFDMLVRAVNISLTWSVAAVAANQLGMISSAAYQLVYQQAIWIILGMGAFTTVGMAAVGRADQEQGKAYALETGLVLFKQALAVSAVIGGVVWMFKASIPTIFSRDLAVLAEVGPAMTPVVAILAILWYKALEGLLIGIKDVKFVSRQYFWAMGLSLLTGLYFKFCLATSVGSVWWGLLAYYGVLTVQFSLRAMKHAGVFRQFHQQEALKMKLA
eukprot:scaffold4808_cov215-Prasinococcus_capsulatus_cf.AAC.2